MSEQHAPEGERIAKVMARAGLCSRREAEAWIAAGRVSVNGATISSPALNIGPRDSVTVDGKPLPKAERTRLFLYHKPRGLVTTHADPQGRPTIFDKLPSGLPRLVSVGRLDLNTEGLLLLTNDGGLARVLELPDTGWLRRYRVRAHGRVTQPALDALRKGVTVDGIRYGAIEATLDRTQGANTWLTFAIREGKNREVRNVLEHLGMRVNRLIRISFGPFQLGELKEGATEEVRTRHLREQLGERIASAAGVDFSGPVTMAPEKSAGPKPAGPKLAGPKPASPKPAQAPGRPSKKAAQRPRKDDRPERKRAGRHPSGRAARPQGGADRPRTDRDRRRKNSFDRPASAKAPAGVSRGRGKDQPRPGGRGPHRGKR